MKKILMICCSDVLGIPAILKLIEQKMLAAIAVTDRSAAYLLPIYQSLGIDAGNLHILTKKNLEAELLTLVNTYTPDVLITNTLSWEVPNAVLRQLPNRCINFHAGLLPKYKGADPVFWTMKNAEEKCGITVHIMTEGIDEGPVIMVEEAPAVFGETYGLNSHRLGGLAGEVMVKLIDKLNTDTLSFTPQQPAEALYFKSPTPAQLTINWQQQTAAEIEALVNAANPRYGGAITSIRQAKIYFLEVAPADVNNPNNDQAPPGTIIHADLLYGLIVACINKQFLKINVLSAQQGFFSGSKMFSMGFRVGEAFV